MGGWSLAGDRYSSFSDLWTVATIDGALKLIHAHQPIARVEVETSESRDFQRPKP